MRATSFSFIGLCLLFSQTACQTQTYDDNSFANVQSAFWEALTKSCGKTFEGFSSFPDSPSDSFYGKSLSANVETCMDNEIHVPFAVGEDRSRTWIFTRNSQGLQLKHQHLHADGTPDEISNYGGIATTGESALVQAGTNTEVSQIIVSFPADEFTRKLLPEASTNVWNITLTVAPYDEFSGISYYLTRHNKPRFKANLVRNN